MELVPSVEDYDPPVFPAPATGELVPFPYTLSPLISCPVRSIDNHGTTILTLSFLFPYLFLKASPFTPLYFCHPPFFFVARGPFSFPANLSLFSSPVQGHRAQFLVRRLLSLLHRELIFYPTEAVFLRLRGNRAPVFLLRLSLFFHVQ